MGILVQQFENDPKRYSEGGFNVPKPELPLAAAVWDAADRFGKSGQTVIETLFAALAKLEQHVHAPETSKSGDV